VTEKAKRHIAHRFTVSYRYPTENFRTTPLITIAIIYKSAQSFVVHTPLCNYDHVSKKDATKLMVVTVTSSNLNRFSNFFTTAKKKSNTIHVLLPTAP